MKKVISILLSTLLITSVICSAPFAVSAAEAEGEIPVAASSDNNDEAVGAKSGTTGDCTWTLDDNGTLTISGNGKMGNYYSYGPWGANIKSVVIENGVTSIGRRAFSDCKSLTSVTIGNSVTSIGVSAFYYCTGLTSITIPDGVTSIGGYAFRGCTGLTSIDIPDSVTSIDSYTFYGCTGLTSVTIPDSVTSIGEYAFSGCTSLTSVTIPDYVTSICGGAFYNTAWYNNQPDGLIYAGKVAYTYKGTMPSNTSIVIKEGTKGIADSVFYGYKNLTSITIPDSVTSIGGNAFYNCKSLISVTIPDSVTSIGVGAFSSCKSLISVTIPDSVTSIGNGAFSGCTGLTSVTVDSGNNIYDSRNNCNAIIKTAENELLFGCKSTVIPDSVTSIGNYAFGYTGLTSVIIPDSVTSIGDYAFYGCESLTSITIPDSVTSIGYNTFSGCKSLTSVTIPDSVTSIGDYAFGYHISNGGEKVANFTIYGFRGSEAEKYAKENNFSFKLLYGKCDNCHAMIYDFDTDVIFDATCTEDGQVFWHCGKCGELGEFVLPALGHDYKTVVTPPTCSKDGYTTYTCSRCKASYVTDTVAATGHDYQSVVTAPTCTKDGYTTHTCSRCKDSYVTDKVAALGHDYHKTAVVPPSCTEKGYTTYICSRCNQSKNEDFVEALGHDCTITVKKQPTKTQQGVMAVDCQRCGLKKNVALPVLSEQDYTLTESAEPDKVTYTLNDKTYGIYETIAEAPDGWFASGTSGNCSWIKKGSVLLIYGNGKMGDYTYNSPAPWKNSNITTVIFDKGVTSIGDYALFECQKLENAYIPETVKSIGKEAFVDTGLTDIYIPSSVTSIGYNGVGYRRVHYYFGDIFEHVGGFTIYGISNSEAYNYANSFENKDYITFVSQYSAPVVPSDIIYKCPHCNEIIFGNNSIIDEAKAPTCTETGLTEGSHCGKCGFVITAQETIPAKGHTKVIDEGKPATCFKSGLTEGSHCSVCGEVIVPQTVINALGHKNVVVPKVPATHFYTGLTEGVKCERCGTWIVRQEEIPKLEGKPVTGDVNGDNVVDVLDASLIQKFTVEKVILTDEQKEAADVNNDSVCDILDATDIQKFTVEKLTEFKKKS